MASPDPGTGGVSGDSEDYAPEVTVVSFDPPLPLLRAPVPSSRGLDGEGPVLAFRDAASWQAAWEAAEASLINQCEAGARSGCSVAASRKCKPPWWKTLFGAAAPTTGYQERERCKEHQERERCEEREMAACLEAAKDACSKFAREKCVAPFQDARIASDGLLDDSGFVVWGSGKPSSSASSLCVLKNNPDHGVTNFRGSDLLDTSLSSKEDNKSG